MLLPIAYRYDPGVPVHVMPEAIVRRVRDDGAEADGQREEALGDGFVPHLKVDRRTSKEYRYYYVHQLGYCVRCFIRFVPVCSTILPTAD